MMEGGREKETLGAQELPRLRLGRVGKRTIGEQEGGSPGEVGYEGGEPFQQNAHCAVSVVRAWNIVT